jgi:hypothetical protein
MSKSALQTTSALEIPVMDEKNIDTARSGSAVSTTSSSGSTESTLSRIANRFRFPNLRSEKRKRNDDVTTNNLINHIDLQATYDKDVREKRGGGAAGARGVGH